MFAEHYAAADFAAHFGTPMDTHITITWPMLGVTDEAGMIRAFGRFTASLRDWLRRQNLPQVWVYAHERGSQRGLHTHFAMFMPHGDLRHDLRRWVLRWQRGFSGSRVARSTDVRDDGGRMSWDNHWFNVLYQLKGFDPVAVVQSARNSPYKRDLMLGELIPFAWEDPGQLGCKRAGVSQEIGQAQRRIGYAPWAEHEYRPTRVPDLNVSAPPTSSEPKLHVDRRGGLTPTPFRSRYEDGYRAAAHLYPQSFLTLVEEGFGHAKKKADEEARERRRQEYEAVRDNAMREQQERADRDMQGFSLSDL